MSPLGDGAELLAGALPMAAVRPIHYHFGMAGELAVRRPSPEFFAIVGSAVTLMMALIGIGGLENL